MQTVHFTPCSALCHPVPCPPSPYRHSVLSHPLPSRPTLTLCPPSPYPSLSSTLCPLTPYPHPVPSHPLPLALCPLSWKALSSLTSTTAGCTSATPSSCRRCRTPPSKCSRSHVTPSSAISTLMLCRGQSMKQLQILCNDYHHRRHHYY